MHTRTRTHTKVKFNLFFNPVYMYFDMFVICYCFSLMPIQLFFSYVMVLHGAVTSAIPLSNKASALEAEDEEPKSQSWGSNR